MSFAIADGRVLPSAVRWLLVCWVILFWRLGYVGLIDDAAHYAELTREMLRHRSWLVPLLDGAPFIDKPVLFHWLQGLAFRLIGETEAAARLPSAVAAVSLFGLTKWVGGRLFDDAVGDRAWLMLATIPATFVLGRVGYLDMLFTTFMFGSVSCLLVASLHARPRLEYSGYVLVVFAVMTKGPMALGLLAGFLGLGWAVGGELRRAIGRLNWRGGLLVASVASCPWFVWMYWQFGDAFVRDYLLAGHLSYLSSRSSASSNTHTFYLQMFLSAFFPWSIVAVGYGVDMLRRRRSGVVLSPPETLLWVWIITVLVLFTLARFRVDRYILPAAPACCLLAARGWVAARSEAARHEFLATRLSIFIKAIVISLLALALAVSLSRLSLDLPAMAFVLPTGVAIGGIAVAAMMLRDHFRPPFFLKVPLWTMMLVYAVVVALGLPLIERSRPVKAVGLWLKEQAAADVPIGVYGLERWHPALRYYTGRRLEFLDDERAARVFLSTPVDGMLIARKDEYLALLSSSGARGEVVYSVPAVVGTAGRGIRRQIWRDVVVIRKSPPDLVAR